MGDSNRKPTKHGAIAAKFYRSDFPSIHTLPTSSVQHCKLWFLLREEKIIVIDSDQGQIQRSCKHLTFSSGALNFSSKLLYPEHFNEGNKLTFVVRGNEVISGAWFLIAIVWQYAL